MAVVMDERAIINKFDLDAVGISPMGFDYSTLESVFEERGILMVEPHRHEYYEILWFTNCSGVHFVDFAAYKFEPHTLFFIAKNQVHAYEDRTDMQGHLLRFDEHFIRRRPESHVGFLEYPVFSPRSSPCHVIPEAQIPCFETLMRLIIEEASDPLNYHFEEMATSLLKSFLLKSERLEPHSVENSVANRANFEIFYNFVKHVEVNYQKHLKVQDYANFLNIGTKRLTEVCNLVAGSSAKKIIQDRVVLEAKRYLYHSGLSVKEICYLIGFEDPAHFSKYFHKVTSLYPLAFRHSISEIYK